MVNVLLYKSRCGTHFSEFATNYEKERLIAVKNRTKVGIFCSAKTMKNETARFIAAKAKCIRERTGLLMKFLILIKQSFEVRRTIHCTVGSDIIQSKPPSPVYVDV